MIDSIFTKLLCTQVDAGVEKVEEALCGYVLFCIDDDVWQAYR
jgi:hypothetical protein